MTDEEHMREVLERAVASARDGGGPFAARVVRDGAALGEGTNQVVRSGDPTAHAEMVAIRAACRATASHLLTGSVLYTTTEPCPMCLGAAWWARIERIVFAADRDTAAEAGFDDAALYAEVCAPHERRRLPLTRLELDEAGAPFAAWEQNPDRVPY